jgi:hypothetical protein
MRARTFYTVAILLPAAALVATLPFVAPPDEIPVPAGGTETWLFPRYAVREIIVYVLMAAWLLWVLRRQPLRAFTRLLWRAPVVIVALNVVLLVPFVLVHGAMRELLDEQGGRIGLRLMVRLAIGYAYLGLTEFVRRNVVEEEEAGSGGR